MNADRRRAPARRLSSKLCRAQAPATQSSDIRPGHAGPAEPDQHVDAARQRGVVGGRREHRAAQGDDARRPGRGGVRRGRGPASRRGCGPTICTRPPRRCDDRLEPRLELGGGVEGAADVGVDVASGRCGSPPAQRAGHQRQRAVAGQEARHQHDRARRGRGDRAAYGGPRRCAPLPGGPHQRSGRPRRPRCPPAARPRAPGRSKPSGCRNEPSVRAHICRR